MLSVAKQGAVAVVDLLAKRQHSLCTSDYSVMDPSEKFDVHVSSEFESI